MSKEIKIRMILFLLMNCLFYANTQAKIDSLISDKNQFGVTIHYNKHNQYFCHGAMLDVHYERIFNRWVGLQTSIGFNRAKVNLNDWKDDYLNSNGFVGEFPSLTSSILFNVVGNFYCINKKNHRLKLGFGLEYRNIGDVITNALLNLDPKLPFNPELIFTQTEFEQYNDLGISGNITYQYLFKKGIGISTSFGYNHYFTYLSKRAYDRNTNTVYRVGGSDFLKAGLGIFYSF